MCRRMIYAAILCVAAAAGCVATQQRAGPPSPVDAQALWVTFWSAVTRGDGSRVRELTHSSSQRSVVELINPESQEEARAFLSHCSIATDLPAVTDQRADYGTRCFDANSKAGTMVLAPEADGTWRILCFNC
jgi:hypothetical protein